MGAARGQEALKIIPYEKGQSFAGERLAQLFIIIVNLYIPILVSNQSYLEKFQTSILS